MLQDSRVRTTRPSARGRARIFVVQGHLDFGALKTMRFRVVWVKNKTHGNEVDMIDGGIMKDVGLVEAVLHAVHVSRDICFSGQAAFVETYLVEMKPLLRDIRIVGRWLDRASTSFHWRIWFRLVGVFFLVSFDPFETVHKRMHLRWCRELRATGVIRTKCLGSGGKAHFWELSCYNSHGFGRTSRTEPCGNKARGSLYKCLRDQLVGHGQPGLVRHGQSIGARSVSSSLYGHVAWPCE